MLKVMFDTQTGSVSLEGDMPPNGVDRSLLEGQTRKEFLKLVDLLAERYGGLPCPLVCRKLHQVGFVILNPKNEKMMVSQTNSRSALTAILRKL